MEERRHHREQRQHEHEPLPEGKHEDPLMSPNRPDVFEGESRRASPGLGEIEVDEHVIDELLVVRPVVAVIVGQAQPIPYRGAVRPGLIGWPGRRRIVGPVVVVPAGLAEIPKRPTLVQLRARAGSQPAAALVNSAGHADRLAVGDQEIGGRPDLLGLVGRVGQGHVADDRPAGVGDDGDSRAAVGPQRTNRLCNLSPNVGRLDRVVEQEIDVAP